MSKLGRGSFIAKMDKMYLRWIAYGMALLLLTIVQSSPRCIPSVFGAHPVPIIALIVSIAMFEGPMIGAVVGAAGGLMWAIYADRLFGMDAFWLLLVGCFCGLLVQLYLRNNVLSALLLNAVVLFFYVLIDWLVRYVLFLNPEATFALWHILLPNAVYTLLISPIMYWVTYRIARNLRETV